MLEAFDKVISWLWQPAPPEKNIIWILVISLFFNCIYRIERIERKFK
jgi:hypothetical protein